MTTNILQHKVKFAKFLMPPARHLLSTIQSAVDTRNPMISFPERPSLNQRYIGVEAVKSMSIATMDVPVQQIPQINFTAFNSQETILEKDHVKANGISVVFTDTLPTKYRRSTISEEEIDYIMRGGRDF